MGELTNIAKRPTAVPWLLFVAVALITVATASNFSTWGDADAGWRASEAWLSTGSPVIDRRPDGSPVYSKYGLLQTVQCLPAALLAPVASSPTVRRFLLALFPAMQAAAVVPILYLICLRLGSERRQALIFVLLSFFGSSLWVYGRYYYGEAQQAACILAAVYLALRIFDADSTEKGTLRNCGLLGLSLGLLVASKLVFVVVLPVFAGVLLWQSVPLQERFRQVGFVALGTIPGALLTGGYNYLRWGSVIATGYGDGRDGSMGFSTPILQGLHGLFFSSGKSVFMYCPLIICGIIGIRALARKLGWRAVCVIWLPFLVLLPLLAKWWSWHGGWGWGPRLLIPFMPVLCLPAIFLWRSKAGRAACWTLGLLGIAINSFGVLIHCEAFYRTGGMLSRKLWEGGDRQLSDMFLLHFDPQFQPVLGHLWILRGGAEPAPWVPVGGFPDGFFNQPLFQLDVPHQGVEGFIALFLVALAVALLVLTWRTTQKMDTNELL